MNYEKIVIKECLCNKFGQYDNVNIIVQDVSAEVKWPGTSDYIIYAACDHDWSEQEGTIWRSERWNKMIIK